MIARSSALVLLILSATVVPAVAQEEDLSRETCGFCHDEAETFAAGPHGRAMAAVDPEVLERSCAACHQPSAEHIEDPLPENVVRVPDSLGCAGAGCHAESLGGMSLITPAHSRHDLACLDCHVSGHGEEPPPAPRLLVAEPLRLCGDCHPAEVNAANLPFAHRDGAEPFSCIRCHSPHATSGVGRLAFGGNGGACRDCHTEKAGPFVFPHPPHQVDGCSACHEPHGSTNPRLLTRRNVLNLCLECHSDVPAFHDLTRARFRACQSCHFAVHGSNREPGLFDE
ncbi:MAG: cytochrome c3 family protein [Thermoanaerobaculia bacterium]